MEEDDDGTFLVGGLRCKAHANWNVKIGVRQLSKASQKTVKMRVGVEDREQAVRRYVQAGERSLGRALMASTLHKASTFHKAITFQKASTFQKSSTSPKTSAFEI